MALFCQGAVQRFPAANARFAGLLRAGEDEAMFGRLRCSECAGRPLGDSAFLDQVEALLRRDPSPGKRGPKAKGAG
jgi:hypothetical protein